ncbi:hypothetical protein ABPG75_009802 [Micractinium tetrahymenae]
MDRDVAGGASGTPARQDTGKLRTYAQLAAAGRSRHSPASGGSGGSGSSRQELAPGGPTTSAFFKPPLAQHQQQPAPGPRGQHRGTPAAGSVTPPCGRSAARTVVGTPDSVASPFVDAEDDIIFQMSGLKPLRTSSRTAAAAAAAAAAAMSGARSHRKAAAAHRTCSAPAMEVEARPAEPGLGPAAAPEPRHTSPLSRAFTFAGELSPRGGAPGAVGSGQSPAAAAPAEEVSSGIDFFASPHRPRPAAQAGPADGSPGRGAAAAAAAEAAPAGGTPGWSEELLSWMLNEKAGLLVEAQRAARRQQELEAELSRLRARGSGAEREAQRLAAERRALLDRVQQLSATEAEAAARVERLTMENDALAAELERSQEVCREMLAARRAARDALSEMSAQNARLLAAYVDKKQEAAQLKEELRQQQRESEARMQALEAQLAAARASRRGLLGSLCSPPASPPQHAGSPCSDGSVDEGPQDGIATPSGLRPESSWDAGLLGGSSENVTPEPSAASPRPNKENASVNAAGTARGSSRARQACKEEWDEERSELLSLLERLQGQLEARAEQQAVAADDSPAPVHGPAGHSVPAHDSAAPCCQPPVGTPVAAQRQQQAVPGPSASSPSSGSSAEASFESVAEGADGGPPTVVAHHMAESPLPPPSASRSGAPSPPSARPQRPAPGASPAAEAQQAGGGEPTPASRAPASEPVPAQQQSSAKQEQPERQQQQQHPKLSSSGGRTLDAFFGHSPSDTAAATAPARAAAAQAAAKEQERLQQAEQRAAELEAEVERLRAANAAAEEKVQREERRRSAEAAKNAGNAAFQAQNFEDALQHYTRGLETLAGSSGGSSSSSIESADAALAAVLHCNRAASHQALGRYLHALADCFRAEALDPSYTRVYHRRADAYWAIGAWDAAAQDLNRLLELGSRQDVAARLVEAQRRCQAGQPAAHYAVLGLRPAATPGEVKAAYRQLARGFHPDKAAGEGLSADAAHALFKLLSEAAGVLGDAEQRRQHDISTLRFKYRRQYAPAF